MEIQATYSFSLPINMTCENCKFSRQREIGLTCHRRPPMEIAWDEDRKPWGVFPVVVPFDWCGEWQWNEISGG